MTIDYLPLTRLVRSRCDGFPINLIEEHFHCTIDSAHIRLKKFRHVYSVQVRGYFCTSFYERWRNYDSADTLPLAIGMFLDAVQEHVLSVSTARCV